MQILGHDVQIIRYGTDKHVYIDGKFDSQYAARTPDEQIYDDLKWIIMRFKQSSNSVYGSMCKAGVLDESND